MLDTATAQSGVQFTFQMSYLNKRSVIPIIMMIETYIICDSWVVLRDFTELSISGQKCELLVAFATILYP